MLINPVPMNGGDGEPRRLFVHYKSDKITITSSYVKVANVRLAVVELEGVVRCLTYAYPIFKVAGITAGIELLLAIPLAAAYGSASLLCVGLMSGTGLAVGAWADVRRNPRWMSIEAEYRGRTVTLLSTRDEREFGQVQRALIRAFEDNRW